MANRERATLPQKTEETVPPDESTASYSQILEALTLIRGFQVDREDKLNRMIEETTKDLASKLEISEKSRNELLTKINQALIGLDKRAQEQTQKLAAHLTKKEQDLENALKEVRQLKVELLNGFMNIGQKNKVPLSHRLAMLGTIAGSSVMGGLIVFLVMYLLLWPHTPVKVH